MNMLRKINIHDVPDTYLRAAFRTATSTQTQMVAREFAVVVRALRAAQQAHRKIRIGFQGHQNGGKTTFCDALVEELCPSEMKESYQNGYSNVAIAPDGMMVHHYDVAGMDYLSFQRKPDSYTHIDDFEFRQHAIVAKHADIQIIEWPEKVNRPRYDWLIEMTHDGNIARFFEGASPRTIKMFCTEEISQLPETRLFIERVSSKLTCERV